MAGASNIARVVKEVSPETIILLGSEGQMHSKQYWERKWVQTFKTSKEAEDYFFNYSNLHSTNLSLYNPQKIHEYLTSKFPEAFKLEQIQKTHDLLVSYQNNLNGQ